MSIMKKEDKVKPDCFTPKCKDCKFKKECGNYADYRPHINETDIQPNDSSLIEYTDNYGNRFTIFPYTTYMSDFSSSNIINRKLKDMEREKK